MIGKLRAIVNYFTDPSNKWTPSSTDRSSSSGNSATVSPTGENSIACDAITNKLTEVADVAESLDSTLRDTQNELELFETNSNSSEKKCDHNRNSSLDEWSSSVKSTEDESFLTASDYNCTPQSRSSSFQTASECHTSPLFSFDKCSLDAEESTSEIDAPPPQLVIGVLSPASESFDSSDHSFVSAQASTQSVGTVSDKNEHVSVEEKPVNVSNEYSTTVTKDDILPEGKPEVRSCEIRQTASWSSRYYENIVTKHTIRGCIS